MRARPHLSPSPLVLVGFLAAVTGLTLAQRAEAFSLSAIAASPAGIWDGRWWLVLTSAPVAQSPILLSLLSLVAVAFAALRCGHAAPGFSGSPPSSGTPAQRFFSTSSSASLRWPTETQ